MGKLVRDLVPDLVRATGGSIETRVLADDDFQRALRAKLVEEAREAFAAPDREALLDELADAMEVINALVRVTGFTSADLQLRVLQKAGTHGRFEHRLFSSDYAAPPG